MHFFALSSHWRRAVLLQPVRKSMCMNTKRRNPSYLYGAGIYDLHLPGRRGELCRRLCRTARHTPAEAVKENVVDATCWGGSYDLTIYCSVCGEELSRESVEVEKKDHTPEVVPGKEATCTQAGLTEGSKCSVCGTVLKEQEEIPPKGTHLQRRKKKTKRAATCTEAGSYDEVVYCSVCEERNIA